MISGASLCIGNYCPHNFKNESAGQIPLVTALMKSLNTVAIRLSIEVGDAVPGASNVFSRAKSGRAKIIATAKRLGVTTPLEDTVSLPLGADGVNVMEMAAAYAGFANGGKRVAPFAAVSISNGRGDVIYRHDRDQPQPEQVVDPRAVAELNWMLHQNVLGGTGRRAALDGHEAAGKTGTTNGYKDAWFDGFTGNYAGVVWYGNDDDSPMKEMTGGSLPASTWHDIMAYAHQNTEQKPIFGVPLTTPGARAAPVASNEGKPADQIAALPRPTTLSKGTTEALGAIDAAARVVRLGRPATKAELRGSSRDVAAGEPPSGGVRVINLR